jgi:hypothetical protein
MKICKSCEFENPDAQLECLQCRSGLELTVEQAQSKREMAVRLTDLRIRDDEDKLRDSWMEAIAHRLDWLWNIGDKIQQMQFNLTAMFLILLMLIVLVGMTWILVSLSP